jgi:hypothetical protein
VAQVLEAKRRAVEIRRVERRLADVEAARFLIQPAICNES